MATDAQIAQLRRMTALEEDDQIYTDSLLGGLIDDLGMEPAVAQVWREKAAAASGLVDTTESGSTRALGQLRKGYLEMAQAAVPETPTVERSFTIPIERV